ncbi:lipopolysaccharide transport periplasmic protein LptA [Thiolinea disciformis]|uniref:lipopolysaccharide transport periplasmic protein LptA n=1 Tax=Thiolinea disciformis TaxID=125614 RepID=UPI00036B9B0C|nr:lipopolysaccharide transport periplasmic protein LptA [Thiolinea disciformis]
MFDPSTKLYPLKYFFIPAVLLFSSLAYALSDDVTKPVTLEADSVIFNKQAGTAVYSGNVQIKQGSLAISAGRIDISAPDNEIQTIRATGNPVRFQQMMDNGKQAIGSAKSMHYFVLQKRLMLEGDASLTQDKDTFSSNQIEYDIRSGELKAGRAANQDAKPNGEAKKPDRVRAIFYPSNQAR